MYCRSMPVWEMHLILAASFHSSRDEKLRNDKETFTGFQVKMIHIFQWQPEPVKLDLVYLFGLKLENKDVTNWPFKFADWDVSTSSRPINLMPPSSIAAKVEMDRVEIPSIQYKMFCGEPDILRIITLHWSTDVIRRIKAWRFQKLRSTQANRSPQNIFS